MTFSTDNMLPDVAKLLDANRLDEEVHSTVSHTSEDHRGLTIGRHHCSPLDILIKHLCHCQVA